MTPVRIRRFFQTLSGWPRAAVLALMGAAAAAALPPLHIVIMLVPAVCGFLWSLKPGRNWRAGFWAGFALGFGFNAAGLYWISNAFLVDPRFAPMIPFMMLGLCGLMALYTGAAGALAALAPAGPRRLIVFAAAWTFMEWARAWAFTGFPWNMTATVWAFHHAPMQPAAWIGGWGLGFFTMLLAGAPTLLASPKSARAGARRTGAALALVCAVWAAAAVMRLSGGDEFAQSQLTLRLVQASVAQRDKWTPGLRLGHVLDQAVLSSKDGAPRIDAVIWPETAAPFDLGQDLKIRALIGQAAARAGAGIIFTGALHGAAVSARGGGNAPADGPSVFNSLYALWPDGRMRARYDKTHLVPFGEYVPLRGWLPARALAAAGRGSFAQGPGRATVRIAPLPPFSPLICYEIIFPGRAYDPQDRPEWLLNITNDAWFGRSAGPFQHFAAARLRAVEEGLPVVRAANTGISGVIDAHGRVIERMGLNERGAVDVDLPPPLKPTFFAENRVPAAFGAVLLSVLALWPLAPARRNHWARR